MNKAMIHRACPVCAGTKHEPCWQKGDLRIVRCLACGMVFVNPAPASMASGEFYDREAADYYLSAAKLESDYADVRFERELRLFRKHCARGAVLDVGCSSGAFLFQLKRRWPEDYEILGTDVSGPPLDYAESRGVPVVRGNFLEWDIGGREDLRDDKPGSPSGRHTVGTRSTRVPELKTADGDTGGTCPYPAGMGGLGRRFDAITFWATLEHLAEPKYFLEKAHAVLKPGGFCFVLVPNLKSLAVRLLGAKHRYVYPQHLNYFTAQTLSRLCNTNFQVIETRFTHFNPVVIWQDWRSGGREVSNQERGELLKRTTAYKQAVWMKPAKWCYALAERTLAAFGMADNVALVLQKRS